MPGLADEHASVLHQLLAVKEGEAPEEVADLSFTALRREQVGDPAGGGVPQGLVRGTLSPY